MSTTSVIGSAVLLRFDGRLLFEVQSRNKWRYDESKVSTIGVGCIGGGIEGNETPIEALHREAIEEIGCELELDTPGNSLYVISGGKAIRAGEHLPSSGVSFFWGGYLTEHRSDTCVAVFHGTTLAQPSPIDLPAVLSIESEQFSSLLDGGLTLDELLELGGQIRSRETIPGEAILDPVGTAFLGRLRHVNEPLFQGCMSNRLPSGSPDDSSRDV